ncbi:hypothetical protein ACL02S_23735 [Nocardia sp. 004]|uniref:hypothetical protein n=1 Tax=Nocardia sp. 004 TaxID=3385978 RepID=UPI0039A03D71
MRDHESRVWVRRSTGSRLFGLLLLVWLAIGLLAAGQRNYFDDVPPNDCARWGTIAVTALAGPLNYVGMNPKIGSCELPEPSR